MELLEQQLDKFGCKVNFYISNKNHQPKVLSHLFRTWEELLSKKRVLSNFYWDGINEGFIIWAENLDGEVLSGVAFKMTPEWQAGEILLAFTLAEYEGRGLSKMCLTHFLDQVSKKGAIRTFATVSINNPNIIKTDPNGVIQNYFGGPVKYTTYVKKIN